MAKTEFEFDLNGMRQVLKSDEMGELLKGLADDMAREAGPLYHSDLWKGSYTYVSSCYAYNDKGYKDNRDNLTLLRVGHKKR